MSRILVLDDRPDDRDLITQVLEYSGYSVMGLGDPHEALDLASTERFDLFVTDILMPQMDGYQLVRRLRQAEVNADTPVVFYTASYLASEAGGLAKAVGVADVIVKPADPASIVAVVERTIGIPAVPDPRLDDDTFANEHLRVVSSKLFEKVHELERTERIRARLLQRLVGAQEEERRRIAADIHDDSVQAMFAVGVRLQMLAASARDAKERATIEAISHTVSEAVARLRHLIFDLRPPMLDSGGLGPALRALLEDITSTHGIEHDFEDRLRTRPPMETGVILYRVAQEALHNVLKHSGAASISVTLEETPMGTRLTITDDGCGFDPQGLENAPGHLGILAMMERLESARGTCEIESKPGAGTTVRFTLPDPA